MKIEIEIEDISLFAQIAVVIDKPNIRDGIIRLREKWTKGKVYSSVKAWKSEGLKINYENDIVDLLETEKISPVFLPVIVQAMVTNKVTHFKRVVMVPIPRRILAEYLIATNDTLDNGDYEYVLVTPIEAERNEVEEEYANMKRAVKRTKEIDNPFEQLIQPILQNPKTSFRAAREWYWMYLEEEKKGRGAYRRILDKWNEGRNESQMLLDQNIIEQAVFRYSKLLKR